MVRERRGVELQEEPGVPTQPHSGILPKVVVGVVEEPQARVEMVVLVVAETPVVRVINLVVLVHQVRVTMVVPVHLIIRLTILEVVEEVQGPRVVPHHKMFRVMGVMVYNGQAVLV